MEVFQLRKKPEIRFNIRDNEFELIDAYTPKNNGVYQFKKLKSASFNKSKVNWYVSIFSILVDLFTESMYTGAYKDRAHLVIELEDIKLEILLFDFNIEKTEEVVVLLNNRIN